MKVGIKDAMGVHTMSGSIRGMCTGYVSEDITLEERDVDEIIGMVEDEPEELLKLLWQLKHRFPAARARWAQENLPMDSFSGVPDEGETTLAKRIGMRAWLARLK